ncbi:MAG: hypothetical protein AVO35_00595 [Candidatus Aegiribacteria sp. MLS_C]|nr:MAG: hypothetical protein AVO35_00595 [Candidatus Aegiribacteria sp. MLS_C]
MDQVYLITGGGGQLGRALADVLGEAAVITGLPELDVTSEASISSAVDRYDPDVILNCAAVADVDLCQRRPDLAGLVHVTGVENLAATGRRLLTISTDHVFTGTPGMTKPFTEGSPTCPANVYGQSKLMGEAPVLEAREDNIVIRTSWMFSDGNGLCPFLWRELFGRGRVRAVRDQRACMTYAPDLAAKIVDMLQEGAGGLYHLANPPGVTPAELAHFLVHFTGGTVEEIDWHELDLDAPRPFYSELGTVRDHNLPSLDDALERWRRSYVRRS